jgi:hypothetical protein
VKCHKLLLRSPQNTKLCVDASIGLIHVVIVLLRPCTGAAAPGMERRGCTEPERSRTLPAAHACARFDTRKVGPQWTTTGSFKVSKAADTCGTLGQAKESCTELSKVEALV